MAIASKWVDIMAKEALDKTGDDLFEKLADSWHWNLYVIQPANIRLSDTADLMRSAKTLFREFVGERIAAPPQPPKRSVRKVIRPGARRLALPPPQEVPDAWMLDQIKIMRQTLGVHA